MLSEKEFKALQRVVRQATAENKRDVITNKPCLFNSKDLEILSFKERKR